jgi:hypothetical protein
MARQCSGITREGTRCARSVEGPNGLCWLHDPTRSDERKRAASKAGKSKPNKELQDIKQQLRAMAGGVLTGKLDRADAAVAGQLLGTVIRAIGMELKVREQLDLLMRIEELEDLLEGQDERGSRWG